MGLFDFAKSIGKKLFDSEEEGGEKIKQHIQVDNPGIDDLDVIVSDGIARIKGKAKDRASMEKAVLMAGNVLGVKEVNADELQAPPEEGNVRFYEIQKGDTLWAIAKQFLGNGNKYTDIFEANREVIKDPDLIYPGQKIRIPLS